MSENVNIYNYSRNFSSSGIFTYNVTCSAGGFQTITLTDSVNVSAGDNDAPSIAITYPQNITYNVNLSPR